MARSLVGFAIVVAVALASAGGAATRAAHVSERAVYSPAVEGRLHLAVYGPLRGQAARPPPPCLAGPSAVGLSRGRNRFRVCR